MNNIFRKISLSNYSLTKQIIIINLLNTIIGLIFLFLFNYLLLFNNQDVDKQIIEIENTLLKITNYLSKNSIIRIPQFNEEICENNDLNNNCGEITLSNPQLDPTSSQKYLLDNYLDQPNLIKIYDDSWAKFVDTENIYISGDVLEVGIEKSFEKSNFYQEYKKNYLTLFDYFYQYMTHAKIKLRITEYRDDIFLVKETIKKKENSSYVYEDENNNIVLVYSSPIINTNNLYGVVIISRILSKGNDEIGLISFNLVNLFLIIIFFMFFLSLLFSKSIVAPIRLLSNIVRTERDRSKKNKIQFNYPTRFDEIGVLSNEIQNMSKDLKNRINEIEGFAADVSHELKNPITSLKSSNDLLLEDSISKEEGNLLLRNMKQDIERMNTLISDISSYTLTQVEIADQIFYTFNIIDFLEDFLQSYLSNSKNIKIHLNYDNKLSNIYANKDKLAQVFINLIENSFSYSPKNSNITIKKETIDNKVVVIFSDQGPGIKSESKGKIFDRFYSDRLSNPDKHSGLGLSIAKKIMENFSGSISLTKNKSQKNIGACFEIIFPLKK